MRQVIQTVAGATFVRDVPPPPCPPASVLVRNDVSVISSGTERTRVEEGQRSIVARVRDRPELALKAVNRVRRDGLRQTRELIRQQFEEESTSGYSSAGTVVEVGAAVPGIGVGDRVACAGVGHASHAEIVSIPRNLCVKVPDGVPIEAAALTTIASIALHGVRLADVRLGDRVAVVGCGLVGQITCRLLAAAGAEVFALDIDERRVAAGVAGGAHHGVRVDDGAAEAVLAATGGVGVDQSLVTAAATTNDPLLLGAELARDRGALVLVGAVPIEIPREALFEKELSFRVSRSYGPGRYDLDYEERGIDYPIGYVRWTEQRNMAAILDLQARGALGLADLVEDVVPVDRAEEAYARLSGPPEERPLGAIGFSYPAAEPDGADRRIRVAGHAPAAAGRDAAVRIGLIGPGGFANSVLVPALQRAGAALAGVAGGSGPSAESTARKAGFEYAAAESELLADESLDAVVIATRHGAHAGLAEAALAAGKHVFCEKPLALARDELDRVLAAAVAAQRVVMVGFNRRFSPHLVSVRDFFAPVDRPLSALYRVSAGHLDPSHWTHDLEQGGGRIVGEGCHFLDSLAFVAGSPIAAVHASGFGGPRQPVQAHDNAMITVELADGSVATLAYVASGSPGVAKERLEVFAGARTAILDDYTSLERFDGEAHERDRLKTQDKGHAAEVAAFLRGVREGTSPIPLETIANVHRACFAAIDSLRTGQPVAVEQGA
jgi:predicted dehydrogenase/threonine dehydrogenase-like Zn-dependent dehydrogenase